VVTTWHLEMHARPATSPSPLPADCRVDPAPHIPLGFYRYLYGTVGAPLSWVHRRWVGEPEPAPHVPDPGLEIPPPSARGAPAGYFELDARRRGEVELAYFGVVPSWIGAGLGRPLLDRAVERAWALGEPGAPVGRVWVHTCSLDHPRARAAYLRAGFVEYEAHEHEEWDPQPLPVHPR